MTSSPSNTEATVHPLQEFADHVAETVGGTASIEADTIKVRIAVDEGADGLTKARDDLDLVFFSSTFVFFSLLLIIISSLRKFDSLLNVIASLLTASLLAAAGGDHCFTPPAYTRSAMTRRAPGWWPEPR